MDKQLQEAIGIVVEEFDNMTPEQRLNFKKEILSALLREDEKKSDRILCVVSI